MNETLKWLGATILGALSAFFGQYAVIIILVILAIVFDFTTGLIKAKVTGAGWDSKTGTKGFWKKIALLAGLSFGIFADFFIPLLLNLGIGFELPFNTPFGVIVGVYIILNEAISICENLYECDPNIMPSFLAKLLKSVKSKFDEKDSK